MSNSEQTDILLETGTNELEVVTFMLGAGIYGINVLKVREIINAVEEVTFIPNPHANVEGVIRVREEVLPVVNLAKVLELQDSENPLEDKFIIGELNQIKVAFRVHHVLRIHRISWEQIEKPSDLSAGSQAYAIGIIKLGAELSVLLDFEKVMVEIDKTSGITVEKIEALGKRERSEKNIVIAEDSAMLRELLKETLAEAGYANLQFFENGKEAWDYFENIAKSEEVYPEEEFQLIITDIEMPRMDGHHLTSKIKDHPRLGHIPIIIFSSLITNDLYHKGERVGADAQVSKPGIMSLVQNIDELIL